MPPGDASDRLLLTQFQIPRAQQPQHGSRGSARDRKLRPRRATRSDAMRGPDFFTGKFIGEDEFHETIDQFESYPRIVYEKENDCSPKFGVFDFLSQRTERDLNS